MNLRRVSDLLASLLGVVALAQLFPLVLCIASADGSSARAFLGSVTLVGGTALLLRSVGHREGELHRREGILVVVGAWLLASIAGAFPFWWSATTPSFVDALFESASGFTTTGASVLVDIEAVARPVLFWRSLTQWLGGIGIVVLFVALLSEPGPGARFWFRLEVPGPRAEIDHPRVHEAAVSLFRIYLALSLAQLLAMLVAGAGLFDALTHTFATVSTGGFSPYSDSIAHFSRTQQAIVLVFMLVAGTNFTLLRSWRRDQRRILRDVELRSYLAIAGAATLVVWIDLAASSPAPFSEVALDAAFQVGSLLTTTGFATADFAVWPGFAQAVLVGLMFVGGCAGSTAGGMKVARLWIGWAFALREVRLVFRPNAVMVLPLGDEVIPEGAARSAVALLLLWVLGWGVGALLLAVGDTDLVTAATASLAAVSNIGPGLSAVGPNESFAFFSGWQKTVLIALMWLGRLEFLAILALAMPRFWRR